MPHGLRRSCRHPGCSTRLQSKVERVGAHSRRDAAEQTRVTHELYVVPAPWNGVNSVPGCCAGGEWAAMGCSAGRGSLRCSGCWDCQWCGGQPRAHRLHAHVLLAAKRLLQLCQSCARHRLGRRDACKAAVTEVTEPHNLRVVDSSGDAFLNLCNIANRRHVTPLTVLQAVGVAKNGSLGIGCSRRKWVLHRHWRREANHTSLRLRHACSLPSWHGSPAGKRLRNVLCCLCLHRR
jgi:hypothetical protein